MNCPDKWPILLSKFPDPLEEKAIFEAAFRGKGEEDREYQPLAELDLCAKGPEFNRYLRYYRWQYRLCSPVSHPDIDVWQRSGEVEWDRDVLDQYSDISWQIQPGSLDVELQSRSDLHDNVAWEVWKTCPTSMLLPCTRELPAVGGGGELPSEAGFEPGGSEKTYGPFYIRTPVVVNFPSFVWLAGREYNGEDELEAWKFLPVVTPGNETGAQANTK